MNKDISLELLLIKDCISEHDKKISDLYLNSGESLLIKINKIEEAKYFLGILSSLIKIKKGTIKLIDKDINTNFCLKQISYVDLTIIPEHLTITDFLNYYAFSKNLSYSIVIHEFNRLLEQFNLIINIKQELKELTTATKHKLSYIITLACPKLLSILVEPSFFMEKNEINELNKNIVNQIHEGNSFIILDNNDSSTNKVYYDRLHINKF